MYSSNLLWTHQKFALSTKSFHRRTSRASVLIVICPLIDLFHLATTDEAWDLHKRSSERRTPRCFCDVETLIIPNTSISRLALVLKNHVQH